MNENEKKKPDKTLSYQRLNEGVRGSYEPQKARKRVRKCRRKRQEEKCEIARFYYHKK